MHLHACNKAPIVIVASQHGNLVQNRRRKTLILTGCLARRPESRGCLKIQTPPPCWSSWMMHQARSVPSYAKSSASSKFLRRRRGPGPNHHRSHHAHHRVHCRFATMIWSISRLCLAHSSTHLCCPGSLRQPPMPTLVQIASVGRVTISLPAPTFCQ